MKKNLKGGMEGVIAAIILAGLVVAIVLTVVVPMSNEGDKLLDKSTGMLVDQQINMKPKSDSASMPIGDNGNNGNNGGKFVPIDEGNKKPSGGGSIDIKGDADAEITPVKPKLDTI